MDILQVYPRLPPAIDGIGDYSLKLATGLWQKYGVLTHFLTLRQDQPRTTIGQFPVIELSALDVDTFVHAVPEHIDKVVVLQFSDYPYDPSKGAPFWLVEALEKLKRQRAIQLFVVFHEFPTFYLLKKTFYLFPWQSSAAWKLAGLADLILTNNAATQKMLQQRLPQPVVNIPVFSNIGETAYSTPLNQRYRRLVVFGTAGRRARIYQRSQALLARVCHALNIEEIYDIGPSLSLNQSEIAGVRLIELGEQPAEIVQQLMLKSLAGIVYSTDNQRLSKSGVFATYCAHGLVPIVTNAKSSIGDGLQAGVHFLTGDCSEVNLTDLQTIADAAHTWYTAHDQSATIDIYAAKLKIHSPEIRFARPEEQMTV